MRQGFDLHSWLASGVASSALACQPVLAQPVDETVLGEAARPEAVPTVAPATAAPAPPAPASDSVALPADTATPADEMVAEPVVQPLPVLEPVMHWDFADAQALLDVIEGIGSEGLIPADYKPEALRAAIAAATEGEITATKGKPAKIGPRKGKMGEDGVQMVAEADIAPPDALIADRSDGLDRIASKAFSWLVEDLRDGRTPMPARVQWFAVDPDQDDMPTAQLMAQALSTHDVAGVLASLDPTHPDYAALKAELAATPPEEEAKRALIRANMDRWRWLARDLGDVYLLTNVPEFQLRLVVKNRNIRTYKTVVGKPGRTATPQLAEKVTAVVFNPTWTVPQSIVMGEGLGAKVLANPGWARANGYKATRGADGTTYVVQQPGPGNALGLMKIDMPNPHAIYLHDTPSKQYFARDVRAFSHGCIRTERAVELGMTMAILGAKMPAAEAAAISRSHAYTKVDMTRTFPVYVTYFTMARDINGEFKTFGDIYGRDEPVLESFAAPRVPKTTQRKSDEPIIELDNPL